MIPILLIEGIDKPLKVGRDRLLPLYRQAGTRVIKCQSGRVERLASEPIQRPLQCLRSACRRAGAISVSWVADHGMANMTHMDPNLVGSASIQLHPQ